MIKGQYTIAQLKISSGISYQTLSDCKIKGQAGEHGCCEAVLELSENTKEGQIRALMGNEASVTLDGKTLLKGIITQAGLKTANGYNSAKIVISTHSINNVHIVDLKTGSSKNKYGTRQKRKNERNYGGATNPNGYTYTHEEIRPK